MVAGWDAEPVLVGAAARQLGRQRPRDRHRRSGPGAGARWAELVGLRTGSGAQHHGRRRRGRARGARAGDAGHPRLAGDPVRLLLADRQSLSDQRRRLHGRQGKSRRERQPVGVRRHHGRLCAQRRGRHFRGRRGADFGGAGAASVHAAALPRHPRPADAGQSARDDGVRPIVCSADLSVRRLLHDRAAHRHLRRHDRRRASAAGGAAAIAAQSRRSARSVAHCCVRLPAAARR